MYNIFKHLKHIINLPQIFIIVLNSDNPFRQLDNCFATKQNQRKK